MKIENIIGWALTIVISIAGAWYTIDARVYSVEKKIELLQMQIDNCNKVLDKQQEDMEVVKDLFNRIDKNIVEIRGILNTKADKKYK
jgi:peptidoglycan hydrolase CwlO-like protein